MIRKRRVKIVATLGPASSDYDMIRALHEAGRSVPAHVSVVGFDDMPESANFWPPLTTVRQRFERVGEEAMSALIADIEGAGSDHARTLVPTSLIVRESSGPRA